MAPKPLFRRRPQRSAVMAFIVVLLGHTILKFVPRTAFSLVMGEMVVAFIALTAVTLFIIAHHRKGSHSRIMNQTQEEVVLIGIFGLFWFAFLLGTRAWNDRHRLAKEFEPSPSEPAWGMSMPSSRRMQTLPELGNCPGGQFMCVIEEVSW